MYIYIYMYTQTDRVREREIERERERHICMYTYIYIYNITKLQKEPIASSSLSKHVIKIVESRLSKYGKVVYIYIYI